MERREDRHQYRSLFNAGPHIYRIYDASVSEQNILTGPHSEASTAAALALACPLELLLANEVDATSGLHATISEESGQDTLGVWRASTSMKRILYVSSPAVVIDPLDAPTYRRNGVNGRVHLLQAPIAEGCVRLEAICTFKLATARLRYALTIQYQRDAYGEWWQVLRPVLLLDPAVQHCFTALQCGDRQALMDCFRKLAILCSQGNHDYLHGTMMRWFAPPAVPCSPEYRALMFETHAPAQMRDWQDAVNGARSGPLRDGVFQANEDPLEYWSLIVHARTIAKMRNERPELAHCFSKLVSEQLVTLSGLGERCFDPHCVSALNLIAGVSAFFALLIAPELAACHSIPASHRRFAQQCFEYASTVHQGLAGKVASFDQQRFYWNGRVVPIFEVLNEYSISLERWMLDRRSPAATQRRVLSEAL